MMAEGFNFQLSHSTPLCFSLHMARHKPVGFSFARPHAFRRLSLHSSICASLDLIRTCLQRSHPPPLPLYTPPLPLSQSHRSPLSDGARAAAGGGAARMWRVGGSRGKACKKSKTAHPLVVQRLRNRLLKEVREGGEGGGGRGV